MKKGLFFGRKSKNLALFLMSAAVLWALTACGVSRPDAEEIPPSSADFAGGSSRDLTAHTAQGVVFSVSKDWTQAEGTDLFYTQNGREVYGLNGVSPLGSSAPEEFFEDLAEYYEGQFDTVSAPEELTAWRSSDGVDCWTADITASHEGVLYCTRLVIAPQKNLALTFCGQAYSDEKDQTQVWLFLHSLCDSLTFTIGSEDYISGNTYLCSDGSQLCLQRDGSFRYYRSADDHENQYYEGDYEVYYGQAAMEKIASMEGYGLTMEELERVLSVNMDGYLLGGTKPSEYLYSMGVLKDDRDRYDICRDTFYAVILNNRRLVHTPDNVDEGDHSTLYLGFYLPEIGVADLTNANAASHTQWVFQKETEPLEG